MLNITNAIKIFGHEFDWDANSTMFWLMVIQIVVLVLMLVIFIILISKILSIKKNMRTKEEPKKEKPAPAKEIRRLINITLDTDVVQKEFDIGEEFNSEGLVVMANYNMAPFTDIVTDFEVSSPNMDEEGKPTVIVSYRGLQAAYAISVSEVTDEDDNSEGPNDDEEVTETTTTVIIQRSAEPTPVVTEPVKEPEPVAVPQPQVVEEPEEESVEGGTLRYDRSFTARLIQADDETKHWYTELKNDLLSYKNVKDRMSWKRETYKVSNQVVARLAYRGKTLCIFLPLNTASFDQTKYKVEDVSENAKYSDTPCMYRIKNEKRVRYAIELLEMVMINLNVSKVDNFESVDYYLPYEGLVELINKGLIKREIKDKSEEAIFNN